MLSKEEVDVLMAAVARGYSKARVARELGCSRPTVYRYIAQGGWRPSAKRGAGCLRDLAPWLRECFLQHGCNAAVVRQELEAEHGLTVSLRTVQRAVQGYRQEAAASGDGAV